MSEAGYWDRRASRRRLLRGAAVLGLGATGYALTACSSTNNKNKTLANGPAASTAAGAITQAPAGTSAALPTLTVRPTSTADPNKINRDGIYHERQTAPYTTINPYKDLLPGLTWGFTIFDHLWYVPTDTGVRELFLASSIEQPDPLNFTVKIKESFFHDKPPANGRAVKAADVKASFEAAAKQTTISASAWWKQVLDTIQTPDESTVVFKLKAVDAWTFSSTNAGSPLGSSILPQEIAAAPDFMDKDLVGSGRYQFVSHENGANFKLKRFDKWRIKGEPWTAGYETRLIQEQAAALAAFSAQQVEHITLDNKLEKDQLVQKLGKAIEIDTTVTGNIWVVQTRADGPWADPRVRQAVYLGLDRDEFIQLMNFGEGAKSGVVPPAFKSYGLDEKELTSTYWKFDPAEGKKLLTAAGFDLQKEYELKYYILGDRPAQFAQIVQAQLQKNLGFKIKLIAEDFGTWLAKSLFQSQYDGFITYYTLEYDDPSSYIDTYAKSNGNRQNSARFFDDDLDKAIKDQKAILDDAKRIEAIKDIQRKAYEKAAPFIPTFVAFRNDAYQGYVKGRVTGRGSFGLFNGRVYIDK